MYLLASFVRDRLRAVVTDGVYARLSGNIRKATKLEEDATWLLAHAAPEDRDELEAYEQELIEDAQFNADRATN